MIKVTNISNRAVYLREFNREVLRERKIKVGETVLLEECTDQIYNLSDPSKMILKLEVCENG